MTPDSAGASTYSPGAVRKRSPLSDHQDCALWLVVGAWEERER